MALTRRQFLKGGICTLLAVSVPTGYIAISSNQGVPVLNYHQINDTAHNSLTLSTYEFEAQMKYLSKEHYTTITPDQLADYLEKGTELPPKPVLITFDDGYRDNYTHAFPILQKYGLTGTIFLISDFVSYYPNYLTWPQIQEMQEQGMFFEGHTKTHMSLITAHNDQELHQELVISKAVLEKHLKKPVRYLAYPCGTYNPHIIDLVQKAGYRAAFTVNLGRDYTGDAMYSLNRIPIFGCRSHSFARFWLRLNYTKIGSSLTYLRTMLY